MCVGILLESKPGRVWEPSGKRVGHLFGCVSSTLLSAWIVNWAVLKFVSKAKRPLGGDGGRDLRYPLRYL